MFRPKPSFWNFLITRKSYAKNLPFGWGVCLYFIVMERFVLSNFDLVSSHSTLIFFSILAVGSLLTGIVLLPQWRKFNELTSIFESGTEISGGVVDIYFFQGGGYITYEYQYQQEKYRSTDSVNRNRKTKDIAVGQKVMLYVNPEKPTQAFIRDLYLNTF